MVTFCKKMCTLFMCMVLVICTTNAQIQPDKYTLTGLIEASKNYMPSLLQKQALINSAQASVKDIKHSFLPNYMWAMN